MYTTILVPLDGSKRAEMILPYVQELALRFKANVVLIRVIEIDGHRSRPKITYSTFELENTEQRIDDAESYLSVIQGEFQERGIQVKTVIEEGPVVKRICQVASSEDVDLLAMASHGRTGLERVFYESVAAGILHKVDRALLLIRARSDL